MKFSQNVLPFIFFPLEWFTATMGNWHLSWEGIGDGEIQDHLLWTPSLVWYQVCFWAQQQIRQWPSEASAIRLRRSVQIQEGLPPVIGVPAYMALGPVLLPVRCLSLLFLSLVSLVLTLFVTLYHQAPLKFPNKNTGVARHFLLHVLPFNVENLHIFHLIYFQLFFCYCKTYFTFFPPDLLFSICCILWLSKIYFANSKESLVNFLVNLW